MSSFDKSLDLNFKEIKQIEKELKILGFSKFRTSEAIYIFKNNKKYPKFFIEKSYYKDNYNNLNNTNIHYTIGVDINERWTNEILLIITINHNKNDKVEITDNRNKYYSKYFENEIRKENEKR